MCIFSLYRTQGHAILTHNRDEDFNRKSSPTLITQKINGVEATYPLDWQGGGTWVLTSPIFTTAILNGALKKHKRNPPYKHSRGEFPLLLIKYTEVKDYIKNLDLKGIEPFTQIILHNITLEAWCLRWDGTQISFEEIEDKVFVKSSATLYNEEEKKLHASIINQIEPLNADNMADAHHRLKWNNKEGFPYVKTTSMVQVEIGEGIKYMRFKRYNY